MKHLTSALFCVAFLLSACGPNETSVETTTVSEQDLSTAEAKRRYFNQRLYHVWALNEYYTQNPDGSKVYPLGLNARGKLILTKTGYFALTFSNPDRPLCAGVSQPSCTAAEVYPTLWRGHLNFAGQLDIVNTVRRDDGRLEGDLNLQTEEALFPNIKDTLQVRHFIMEPDTKHMRLEQPSIVNPGAIAFLFLERLD
jgi:Lipocalin-like domain